MKTVQQKLRWPGVMTGVALLALLFASCSKVSSDSSVNASTTNLAVIDVSPTAPDLDFYLDGARVNSTPITYGGGLEYFICYAGNRHVSFYQANTTTIVKADTVNLAPNAAYTLVLSNLPSSPDVTLLRDSIYAPASTAATIRLVNASPDAGAVDFGLKGKSVMATNVAYRKASSFISTNVTTVYDTVAVYKAGTSTILQTVPVPLAVGGVYTVYLYGFQSQSSAAEKLGLGVVENTFYY